MLDCGPGVLSSLQRNHRCADLSAVFITHLHMDHCMDLLPLASRLRAYSRRYEVLEPGALKPVPVFLPPGGLAVFSALTEALGAQKHTSTLALSECTARDRFELGPFRLSCHPMDHGVTCQAVRVVAPGAVFAYSGDSRLHDGFGDLAREADLFLCEATGRDPEDPRVLESGHLTGVQAGTVARAARARRLMLTHFTNLEPAWREGLKGDAGGAFGGPVLLAEYGAQIEVGA